MKKIKIILTFIFGVFMIYGGVNHFLKPQMFFPFFPDSLPKEILNNIIGILEIIVGLGVFIPQWRKIASVSILIMMLAFLPLHIWDVFRENPAIGNHKASLVRLPFQFVLIAWAWYISKVGFTGFRVNP